MQIPILMRRLRASAGDPGVEVFPTGNGAGVWSVHEYTKLLSLDNDPVVASKDDDNEVEWWPLSSPEIDATEVRVTIWQKRQQNFTIPGNLRLQINGVLTEEQLIGPGIDDASGVYHEYTLTFVGSWSAADFGAGWNVRIRVGTDNGQGPPGPMLSYDKVRVIVKK